MSNQKPYLLIRAYCKYLGSKDYFIRDEIREARANNAPGNAIYKRQDGSWATIDDVKNPAMAAAIKRLVR